LTRTSYFERAVSAWNEMNFDFSESQEMLRDTLSRFLAANHNLETRRRYLSTGDGRVPGLWRALASELGILAAPFEESLGGLGGSPVDTMVIMEEFGKALLAEPFVETVVLCGGVLKRASREAAKATLGAVIAGEAILAFAHGEPQMSDDIAAVRTTARRRGSTYLLRGRKAVVRAAPWADQLIVSARTDGDATDRKGITLFLVNANSPRIELSCYATIDGARAADIALDDVEVPDTHVLGEVGEGLTIIEQVVDEAIAAICADAIGCMRSLLSRTVDYAGQRRQFGVPISSFQVLRHRMVNMYVALEQAVSMTYCSTLSLDASASERAKAASAAKVQVGKSCRYVGEGAIQIHGGMGISDELAVGQYFKRVTVIGSQFGSAAHHIRRFSSMQRE
jgi:alkylation response protein AidB-like acyl-CoA dehydrogenase